MSVLKSFVNEVEMFDQREVRHHPFGRFFELRGNVVETIDHELLTGERSILPEIRGEVTPTILIRRGGPGTKLGRWHYYHAAVFCQPWDIMKVYDHRLGNYFVPKWVETAREVLFTLAKYLDDRELYDTLNGLYANQKLPSVVSIDTRDFFRVSRDLGVKVLDIPTVLGASIKGPGSLTVGEFKTYRMIEGGGALLVSTDPDMIGGLSTAGAPSYSVENLGHGTYRLKEHNV